MKMSTTSLRFTAHAAIDLHLHTRYSDGNWRPDQLLSHLHHARFDLAAITDHDRADTIADIQQMALDHHVAVLAAVEMSTTWQGQFTDLLCYGLDPDHNALNDLAQDLLHRQQDNSREVFENLLHQGYILPPDALARILARSNAEQPHALAALLREHGYGLGEPSAGKIITEAGCKFATNDPGSIVEAAHRSGAVCLLAHPGRDDGFVTYDMPLLDQFRREAAIDGLEVYYPLHSPAQTAMYQEYAQRHHLLTSAGSDSHGPDRSPIRYPAELCRDLLERVGIQVM